MATLAIGVMLTALGAEKLTIQILQQGYSFIRQKADEAKTNKGKCKTLAAKCEKLSKTLMNAGSSTLKMDAAKDLQMCQIEVLQFINKFTDDTWWKKIKKLLSAASILEQFDALEKELEFTQMMMLMAIIIANREKANETGENVKLILKYLNLNESKDKNDDAAKEYRKSMLQKQASVDIINAAQAKVAGDKHAEERELRNAIENNPKSRTAWNNLGLLLKNHRKDYVGAEDAYKEALAIDPNDAVGWYNLGSLLDNQEDYVGAEDAFRKALAIDPKDADIWNNLGILLQDHKKDFDGAEAAYREAIVIEPEDPDAWNNLGILLQDHKKDFDRAIFAYREAIDIEPEEADTWYSLGDLLADHKNDIFGARKSYKKVLKIDPNHTGAEWIRCWLNENPKPESKKKKKRQTK